jgi:trehalose utilization protein
VIEPSHPIAQGLGENIIIPHEEMYGERFNIPAPDELIFISWFEGGEVFRSGCCYRRGRGKVFYFQPGHETFPIYHQKEIRQVIINAVKWAVPQGRVEPGIEESNFKPNAPIMQVRDSGFRSIEGLHQHME